MDRPRVGTPAARMERRCSCGADAQVVFDGLQWCALCALFAVGDAPARRWRVLEFLPPKLRLGEARV